MKPDIYVDDSKRWTDAEVEHTVTMLLNTLRKDVDLILGEKITLLGIYPAAMISARTPKHNCAYVARFNKPCTNGVYFVNLFIPEASINGMPATWRVIATKIRLTQLVLNTGLRVFVCVSDEEEVMRCLGNGIEAQEIPLEHPGIHAYIDQMCESPEARAHRRAIINDVSHYQQAPGAKMLLPPAPVKKPELKVGEIWYVRLPDDKFLSMRKVVSVGNKYVVLDKWSEGRLLTTDERQFTYVDDHPNIKNGRWLGLWLFDHTYHRDDLQFVELVPKSEIPTP